jgi:hypothetical protein
MDKTIQKTIVNFFKDGNEHCFVHPDKVIAKRDENHSVELRFDYFYAHGQSAEKWQKKVVESLQFGGYRFIESECWDCWNPWPRDSYFQVIVKEVK